MPLPKPKTGEDKDKFVSRCMSNSVMKTDFPNNKQRLAVCFSQFSKKEDDEMETKEFEIPFELKTDDDDKGSFEGHAAIFNKADQFGDVILPGAFTKSLHTHPKRRVKMLRQHKVDSLIGVWDEIKEDSQGLFVRGHLLMQLSLAQETFILMKEKLLDSMSIGFRTIIDQFDTEKKVRNILELKLFEISVVTFPAQLGALVSAVKNASPEELTTKTELENALRNAGFSVSTSKYICSGWSPPAQRNAEGGDNDILGRIHRLTKNLKTATEG